MYWSFSWARILNVQDIIKKRTKETVKIYPQRVFLLPPSLKLASNHSVLVLPTVYFHTDHICLPINFRFNVEPTSQLIADSIPVNRLRRWPNTDPSLGLLYTSRKQVAFTRCCFNVDPQSSTLARH